MNNFMVKILPFGPCRIAGHLDGSGANWWLLGSIAKALEYSSVEDLEEVLEDEEVEVKVHVVGVETINDVGEVEVVERSVKVVNNFGAFIAAKLSMATHASATEEWLLNLATPMLYGTFRGSESDFMRKSGEIMLTELRRNLQRVEEFTKFARSA